MPSFSRWSAILLAPSIDVSIKEKLPSVSLVLIFNLVNSLSNQFFISEFSLIALFLILDWDCKTELPLDAVKELRLPSPSMPLYSYPSDYHHPLSSRPHWDMLQACSWEFHNSRVLPNACFIYTKDTNIGKELLDIVEEYGLDGLTEEFAMYLYTNCSLDEYIKRYDTPYLNGRGDNQIFIVEGEAINTAKKLNNYIGKKEILFHHD